MREIGEVICSALAPGYDDARRVGAVGPHARADGALPAVREPRRRRLDAAVEVPSSAAASLPLDAYCGSTHMKIWIDMTAPAHVLVFRPLIPRLQAAGHEVEVTARDYAQTLELLELHGMEHTRLRPPRRRLAAAQARARCCPAPARCAGSAAKRSFDLALAHGSNDLALAARRLKIPAVNMFDYEFATLQHNIGCRPARRVIDARHDPARAPAPLRRRRRRSSSSTRDSRRSTTSRTSSPTRAARPPGPRLASNVIVVVRPPPDVSLYHRKSNPLFPQVLTHVGSTAGACRPWCCRAPRRSASTCAPSSCRRSFVPEHAVDAQSLVALADLVVSAGGTMNREAVALGTPVYTTYGGRLGGVDEALIRERRLRPLTDPRGLELVKRAGDGTRTRRDPALLMEMILGAVQ